ncbi:hypothetical protein J8I87_36895 [Paraburkholderia sp. LEh10]|uniref:hypothetical protein n=1 Tax=Paraburkholderia sp. LEh10 TaxID=2821353 RepID=UPI001AE641B9|nr:hypothetical protein [Paraburkholderia sp. LEh10]MBP0595141.1 hypothetical protein [Paraburkholderia sp. LEh10]
MDRVKFDDEVLTRLLAFPAVSQLISRSPPRRNSRARIGAPKVTTLASLLSDGWHVGYPNRRRHHDCPLACETQSGNLQ